MASFCKLNLIAVWPSLPPMDVVFLRNVLIYFRRKRKGDPGKGSPVTAPHGVLFLGAAETTMGLDAAFVRVQINNSVFYRLK